MTPRTAALLPALLTAALLLPATPAAAHHRPLTYCNGPTVQAVHGMEGAMRVVRTSERHGVERFALQVRYTSRLARLLRLDYWRHSRHFRVRC